MASITIQNLDDDLKDRLRVRAAHHRHSMEEEVRHILHAALGEKPSERMNLGEAIHQRFKAIGGVRLKLPQREPMCAPPKVGS